MSQINIEAAASELLDEDLTIELQIEALKTIALSRLASSLERIGMNDAVGTGPGCLEKIGMELSRLNDLLEEK